jgi:hypothetical protein
MNTTTHDEEVIVIAFPSRVNSDVFVLETLLS